jgi:hypothetical protein
VHALIFLFLHGISQQQAASQYVNFAEPKLHANREAYLRGPRTAERQKEALAVFDHWWVWLNSPEACGNVLLDDAGEACLHERGAAGRWPWKKFYRDPILENGPVSGAPAISTVARPRTWPK